MKGFFHIGRRRFLQMALAQVVLLFATRAVARDAGAEPTDLSTQVFGILIKDAASAGHIGRICLENYSSSVAPGRLVEYLRHDLGLPMGAAGNPVRICESIRRRQSRDYEKGAVLRVDGWVISRTEANLCTLWFLQGRPTV